MRRPIAALLVLTLSGCSYLSVRAPRIPPPDQPVPPCGTSRAAPAMDGVLTFIAAIPTTIAVAIAWDDPVWERSDGALGGAQVGAYLGIPWALIGTLTVFSARHGLRAANRCEALQARASGPSDPHDAACRAAFQTIADGHFSRLDGLPSWCTLDTAEHALLLAAESGTASHGEPAVSHVVRTTTETFAGAEVRLWLAGGIVVGVEIVRPRVAASWRQLLGEPDARLDAQWIYATRGLAVIATDDAVDRVILFAPTTVDGYRAHFAPRSP